MWCDCARLWYRMAFTRRCSFSSIIKTCQKRWSLHYLSTRQSDVNESLLGLGSFACNDCVGIPDNTGDIITKKENVDIEATLRSNGARRSDQGEASVKQKRENFFSKHQSSLLFVDGSKKFTKPMWFPKAPKAIDRWCSFNIRTQTKRDVDHYGRVKCLLFDSHLHSRSINLAVPKRKGRWVIITWNSTEACSLVGLVCHPNTIIQTWVSIISSVILDLARALLWNESRTFNVEHDTCGIVLGKNVSIAFTEGKRLLRQKVFFLFDSVRTHSIPSYSLKINLATTMANLNLIFF